MDLVEPHPLDYDWRYTAQTCEYLLQRADGAHRCLCIGAPSVARALEAAGRHVVLVDRQPIQRVQQHWRMDPSYDPPPAGDYDVVFIDPPWYPNILQRWLAWAAAMAGRPVKMFCSLWPASTRPGAAGEHARLFEWIQLWARTSVTPAVLGYESPPFEIAAASLPDKPLATHRWGDLIELAPFGPVDLPPPLASTERWHRFVFNAYQLALRERPDPAPARVRPHPLARGWVWPSVSRRAPGRAAIDLWSSRNEVAIVDGTPSVVPLLRALRDPASTRHLLATNSGLAPLAQWHLATLDFHRTAAWTHLA